MSQEEKTNIRDQSYSAFHREYSTVRFVKLETARQLTCVDIDMVEYGPGFRPLALFELTTDPLEDKPAFVTANLAKMAGLPAYKVRYHRSHLINPYSRFGCQDIDRFEVQEISTGRIWYATPREYVRWLARHIHGLKV